MSTRSLGIILTSQFKIHNTMSCFHCSAQCSSWERTKVAVCVHGAVRGSQQKGRSLHHSNMGTDALFVRVQRRHPCALLIRCILVQAAWEDPDISDNKTSRFGAPCFLSNHSASGNTEQRPGGISGTQFIERVTPSLVSSCSPFLAPPTNTNWTDSIRMHGGSPAHRGTGLARVVRQRASPLAALHACHSAPLWLPQIAAMVDCGE